ncbi:MAG TPA: AAA family ATPase [Acidimicrobiia bacterium]
MLHHLRVVNLGVIADTALDFSPGLNVITGETGTGKTLLLGGLRLLLGDRADGSLVGGGEGEARVEGLFGSGDEEIAVVRTVPAGGKSRAYADGVLVSAATLAEKVGMLVEIVGQHDQLAIRRPATVLGLVDSSAPRLIEPAFERYQEAWDRLRQVEAAAAALGGDGMALRRELDLVAFQSEEISRHAPMEGEDAALEVEASRLRNIEELTLNLADAARLLEQMSELGGETVARLRKVADLDPSSGEMATASELLMEQLSDLAREAIATAEGLDRDEGRLEEIETRLTTLGDLKRKYGPTLAEVIEFGRRAARRAAEIEETLGAADQMEERLRTARADVQRAAAELTTARKQAASELTKRAMEHLADLGMGKPRLEMRIEPVAPGPSGADRVEAWFSSDPRLEPAPVGSGASGGELSRLVLAIRLAARSEAGETLVFDEVDTGVGGVTALALGRKLADLAEHAQVICVTHLPQVAAFARSHFVVTRDEGRAHVVRAEGDDRVREITRMLAGLPESEAGQVAAKELLELAASVG